MLSRVSADAGMRRFIEQRLQPVVRQLGFRTAEFAWSRYAQWLAGARGMELVERRPVPPLGHFSLIRFRKAGRRGRRLSARSELRHRRVAVKSSHVIMMSSHGGHRIRVLPNPNSLWGR